MSNLHALRERLADVDALYAAIAIMDWDQQTHMPKGGSEARAAHVGILSRLAHERFTADETRDLVTKAASEVNGTSTDAALVRVVKRDLDLATKIPTELVQRKAELAARGHDEWVTARAANDFKSFAPTLARMFDIAREEAEHLGYTDHIYDALFDQYEQGATAADARAMFDALRQPTIDLLDDIRERGSHVPEATLAKLEGDWDTAKQSEFTLNLVKAIGFDLDRGRQDTAHHPFCTGWSVNDVRLTTRFQRNITSAIFGSLHEAGHGMYEQGSPAEWDRTPLAGGVSLGLHESQSRTWENIVGRSRPFWSRFLPDLQANFPALAEFDLDTWYRSINRVRPSLIRVEADEVTYNLHVAIRFEIECAVLEGTLAVTDIPEAWNQKYRDYLGIEVPSDRDGCLQDVHWSGGSIGYFPTYSMGNLLSYQIWNVLKRDLGDVDALMAKGDFAPILAWLQTNVYRAGRSLPPRDLVMKVTGKPIGADDYVAGLRAKYSDVYGLA